MSGYLAEYDETLEAAAKRLAGNWRRFECFGWDMAREPDANRRCIVYTTSRDADALTRSNARHIAKVLSQFGDDARKESHGHWAVGHVDGWAILVYDEHGDITPAFRAFYELAASLEEYPILDEGDFSNEETEEANEVWTNCYSAAERIEYIRKHRSQFEFHDLADMMGCVRGRYFAGYASELLA